MAKIERDIYRCIGCGLESDKVEAGGIYYCPNPYCTASGAWSARLERGYQDSEGKVDGPGAEKWLADCRAAVRETKALYKAYKRTLKKLEKRYG